VPNGIDAELFQPRERAAARERLGLPLKGRMVLVSGHLIPRKDGSLPERHDAPLLELEPGQRAVISRVPDDDPGLLRWLAGLGLTPGTRVELVARDPYDGPLIVRAAGAAETCNVSRRVARVLFVGEPEGAGVERKDGEET